MKSQRLIPSTVDLDLEQGIQISGIPHIAGGGLWEDEMRTRRAKKGQVFGVRPQLKKSCLLNEKFHILICMKIKGQRVETEKWSSPFLKNCVSQRKSHLTG